MKNVMLSCIQFTLVSHIGPIIQLSGFYFKSIQFSSSAIQRLRFTAISLDLSKDNLYFVDWLANLQRMLRLRLLSSRSPLAVKPSYWGHFTSVNHCWYCTRQYFYLNLINYCIMMFFSKWRARENIILKADNNIVSSSFTANSIHFWTKPLTFSFRMSLFWAVHVHLDLACCLRSSVHLFWVLPFSLLNFPVSLLIVDSTGSLFVCEWSL